MLSLKGLLPLLKSIHKHCTLKKFAGQTIGIDAYGWLHRGTVACAIELALDKPTTKYVDFAMGRVRMLLDFGVKPYLVFDGDNLPSKAGTNGERRKRRDESKALGLELYKAGKLAQAHQELQKAADVTPYMARLLIEELKKMNVQYLVAPYEADAQLVYLEQQGIINGILSEDSDMLVFGAKRLLTKLNQYGECIEIDRADFALCKEISLTGWTDAMFRRMAILSGCDYLSNIDKMGLKTAYRYVRKYKETEKTLQMIQLEGKFVVPTEYSSRFDQAELTFLHHRVFSPVDKQLAFLHELPRGMKEEDMPFLGPHVDPETAIGVACGDLDPKSKETIRLKPTDPIRRPLLESRKQTSSLASDLKHNKSLESFFTVKRRPLAELDPNSLTPSPSQQRLIRQYRNTSWEPRSVSSAPQLRSSASLSSESTTQTDRGAFLAGAATRSNYQAPKRQRLCSDAQDPSPSKEVKQSPFFASVVQQPSPLVEKKARNRRAKKASFDVWSDDSVDDVLLGLPDVQQQASPEKSVKQIGKEPSDALSADNTCQNPVIQSSPGREVMYPSLSSLNESEDHESFQSNDTATATEGQTDDLEPFEDVLESHIRIQRESLLRSFVYQSPSRRESALKSLSPQKPTVSEARARHGTSAGQQVAAPRSAEETASDPEHVDNSRRKLQDRRTPKGDTEGSNRSKHEKRTSLPINSSMQTRLVGSEDALLPLIPNSEDERSELDQAETPPTLNLKAFEFVHA